MTKPLALKYLTFLSRRKYNFMCKIQQSTYDPESQSYRKNTISYGESNLDVKIKSISHNSLDLFVKSLDIGQLHQIDGYSGITRTVTALATMIVDLNSKVLALKNNLLWFNGNTDNGAPESAERTMTIGTLPFGITVTGYVAEISIIYFTQYLLKKKMRYANNFGNNIVKR